MVTIPIVKSGDDVFYSKQVPRKWWEYEEHVERMQERLKNRYSETASIEGIGMGTTNEFITQERKKSSLIVYVDPVSGTDESIPESVEGVPVKVKEAPRPDPDGCYQEDYDPVPGGVSVHCPDTDEYGTATCPVQDSSGTVGLMTCGHIADDCKQDVDGLAIYQNSQFVGYIDDNSVKQDWIFVPKAVNSDISGFADTIVNTYRDIAGYVDRQGLKDLKSTGETVYKKGRTSCKTDGVVKELDVSVGRCGCPDCKYSSNDYVKVSTPTDSGDSGSPHYHTFTFESEKYIGIIAPHHGGESVGIGAYKINDDFGYTFGTD